MATRLPIRHNAMMNKNLKGFISIRLSMLFIFIAVIVFIFIGWIVFQKLDISARGSYRGSASVWLSGATDDKFINYYKLEYELNDMQSACSNTSMVKTKIIYNGNRLTVTIFVDEKWAEVTAGDACMSWPKPYHSSIDIDKNWLSSIKELEIDFNGEIKYLKVDQAKYIWYIDESIKMPFIPDKVAVVKVSRSCNDPMGISSRYVTENSLKLASELHEGIELINEAPNEQVLITYDNNAEKAHQIFLDKYMGPSGNYIKDVPDCTPYISKPVLNHRIDIP